MRDRAPRPRSIGLAALVSVIAFLLLCPSPRNPSAPLPADMASHTLGAVRLVDAVRDFDPSALARALLARDLYPPGHSIVLATWMLVWGESPWSLWFFRCVLLMASALAFLRLASRGNDVSPATALTATAIGLASPFLLGLSTGFLVEPVAIALLLWTLVALDRANSLPTAGRVAMATLLLAATLLTKYNVGLPMLPALGVLALWIWLRGERRKGMSLALVVVMAAGAWALFLTLQVDGWASFLSFAKNRSNTADWTAPERLNQYLKIYTSRGMAHWGLALLTLLLIASHWRRPRRSGITVAASVLYILFTLVALGRHPYLLSRNLTAVMAVLGALAALGAVSLQRKSVRARSATRASRIRGPVVERSLSILAVIWLAISIPGGRAEQRKHDPPELAELEALSELLREEMEGADQLLVLGCFNELSPGYLRLLRRDSASPKPLWIELDSPMTRTREGIPADFDPAYLERMRAWRGNHAEANVVLIELAENSNWWDEGYEKWSRWKSNWRSAIEELDPPYPQSRRVDLEGGVSVTCFAPAEDLLRFTVGWSPPESWGRWAQEHRATLRMAAGLGIRQLVLEAAPFEAMRGESQRCWIQVGEQDPVEWTLSGKPWDWETLRVELPGGFSGEVHLEFERRWPTEGKNDPCALPFRRFRIEGGSDPLLATRQELAQ